MVDLHCHILPQVDDGAASPEESCAMAELAAKSGVTDICATPHCNVPGGPANFDSPPLRQVFVDFARLLQAREIPVRLHAGMEVFVTPDTPKLMRQGKLLTLGGSRYLLTEFGFDESPEYVCDMLSALRSEGVTPVIAHPERYRFVQGDRKLLSRWVREGYVLQINKGSLFGMFGRRAAETAHWCMGEGCVHLIASDAHSPFRRTTRLRDAWEYAADLDSPAIADFLLRDNPARILADRPIRPVLAEF